MANTSLRIGGNNWAVKEDNLLGYNVIQNKYVPIEIDTVRETTATRVNENGLIEVVPKNLLLQSNTFSTTWSNSNSTETSGQIGYDGSSNAWLLTKTGSSGFIQQILAQTGIVTQSIYVKANDSTWCYILNGVGFTYFNLFDGVIGSGTDINSTIESAGNGWYKISITTNGCTYFRIYPAEENSNSATSGSIFIQNAQVEQGSTATSYFPTTDRLNVPRLDYTNGSCPSILVEPQRTNLMTYSEDFSQSSWSKVRVNVTSQSLLNPKGELSVNKIESNNSVESYLESLINFTSSTSQVFSYFAKKGNANFTHITFYDGVANGCRQWFDLENGVLGTSTSFGSGITIGGANIEDFGNGWCKVSVTSSTPSITSFRARINISETNGGVNSAVGSYIYATMAQLELGSYATSYIPTVASSVTRNADVISKTGISGLIGQTEGTLFFDGKINSNTSTPRNITLSDGTGTNRIILSFGNNGAYRVECELISGGVNQTSGLFSIMDMTVDFKLAFSYATNSFKFFINGVKIAEDLLGTTFTGTTLNKLAFLTISGTSQVLDGNVKQLQLYKTALTDEELQQLTTL